MQYLFETFLLGELLALLSFKDKTRGEDLCNAILKCFTDIDLDQKTLNQLSIKLSEQSTSIFNIFSPTNTVKRPCDFLYL